MKEYIINRLKERSFWVGAGTAVVAATVLPYPWNIMSFLFGFIGSLVPDATITAK